MARSDAFQPDFATCETHGRYQQTFCGDDNVLRSLPECPGCTAAAKARRLLDRAGIPPRFMDRRLDNFRARSAGQKKALADATEYAEQFSDMLATGRCMAMIGRPGTGKTHLACAIAHRIMEQGYSAIFIGVSDAIREIRSTWGSKERSEADVLRAFSDIDLLILDEVGVQYGSEAEQITLFDIINRRYTNVRPTIVLSNLPAESADKDERTLRTYLGDRSFDRLREGGGKLVIFDWDSYRKQAA